MAASAASDLPSWWSDDGMPGWNPDLWLDGSPPWGLAGLSLGGWSMQEPGRAPQGLPAPGVSGVQTPVVWYDSVAVITGAGAAWQGFGATLATAYGFGEGPAGRGSHTVVDLRNGSFNFDENALSIERGDSLRWLRGEAVGGQRGVVEALDDTGRHLWGAAGGIRRGPHTFQASFSQRGASISVHSSDEQVVGGQSGSVSYRYRVPGLEAGLSLSRGLDHHESFGLDRATSRREAQEFVAAGEVVHTTALRSLGARVEWRRSSVVRSLDPFFQRGTDAGWVATRYERWLGEGRLRLELGAGRHAVLESFQLAPGVTYAVSSGQLKAQVGLERLLYPVWADLAPGQTPFLQRTWAASFDVTAGESSARHVEASLLLGRTEDRALVTHLPLDDLWLRIGATPDPEPYNFALVTAGASLRGRWLGVGGSGFGLLRNQNPATPAFDPGVGARAWGEWRFSIFGGDLGVTLRGEADRVGARDSEGAPDGVCADGTTAPSRRLPGYWTSGTSGVFRLAGVIITVRVRNLENRHYERVWYDCQDETEALGPGREWRFALTTRLTN